ncbi:MAG: DNA-protecting protein DprA [Deltaproteobacteria bacterium]|nr:DNA-protecting protein DprA [Deltaproteobacteria bacterium]
MRTTVVPASSLGLSGDGDHHLAGVLPSTPRLAVVGSRAAHRRFRDAVEPIVQAAARRGFSIVSGGAVGIDADAHAAALAAGVPQVAVLPCGPDKPYPPQHQPLFEAIVESGHSAVLHARPPGTVPTRAMFASRNALVVGLVDAVVVVEAAARSGTMITATVARRRGKARAAVVGSAGAAVLVARGAHALPWECGEPARLCRATEQWLRAVADDTVLAPPPAVAWPPHLGWLHDALADAGERGVSVDALPSPRAALMDLTEAQTLGLVTELGPGRYVRAG